MIREYLAAVATNRTYRRVLDMLAAAFCIQA